MSAGIFDQSVDSGSTNRIVSAYISASYSQCIGCCLALRRLPHRLMDDVPVMPFRFALQVLEHLRVFAIHVWAVGVLPIRLLAIEDHAEPDLIRILHTPERRVVAPTRRRVILEGAHVFHELFGVSRLDSIPSDRSKHLTSPPPDLS